MSNAVIVIGSYDNRLRAETDYEHLAKNARELWKERVYALGLVERSPEGKVRVINTLEPDTNIGTISGTVVGGLVGILYPPFVVFTAAAGAGIGRALTHLWHGVSRRDILELGAAIDTGEGAVLIIATHLPDDVDSALPNATHVVHRTMTHRHEDIEALISELRRLPDPASADSTDAGEGAPVS